MRIAQAKFRTAGAVQVLLPVAIVLFSGVYLISRTVLISADGVRYIRWAQNLATNPHHVIEKQAVGYPFLIFVAHEPVSLFCEGSSAISWAYSGQCVSLLCRVLAFIGLYFVGRLLFGGRYSFWALVVLALLPDPARYGSDVLREWPYLLWLVTGLAFLVWAARYNRWWAFGLVGLSAGLGYLIRPECAQLVVYALGWLLVCALRQRPAFTRAKVLAALGILLLGFAVPVVPYTNARGRILPPKLRQSISLARGQSHQAGELSDYKAGNLHATLCSVPTAAGAAAAFLEGIGENLRYFFALPLVLGLYHRLIRKRPGITDVERFFIPAFVMLNVFMLVLLYTNYGYISRRHTLPTVVCLIFYVPVGLQLMADRLEGLVPISRSSTGQNSQLWFLVLLTVGVSLCVPKLLRPMRADKREYVQAAQWLKANSTADEFVVVPDRRISFYAERRGYIHHGQTLGRRIKYFVTFAENNEDLAGLTCPLELKASFSAHSGDCNKRLLIYRVK